jgi:hypothetical protein
MQGCHSRVARRLVGVGSQMASIRSASIGPFGSFTTSGEGLKLPASEFHPILRQWQFLGPEAGTLQWQRVPNTLMHDGKPVTPPTTKPATSIPGAGSVSGSDVYNNPGIIQMINDLGFCTGVSSVSVTTDDGTFSSSGFYTFPC